MPAERSHRESEVCRQSEVWLSCLGALRVVKAMSYRETPLMAAAYFLRLVTLVLTTFQHEHKHFPFLEIWQAYNVFESAKCGMWINCTQLKEASACRMSCPDRRIDVFVTEQDDLFWQYIKRVSWLAGQGTSYSQNAGDINTGKAACCDSHCIAIWWQADKFVSQTVLHGKDIAMHWTSSPFIPSSLLFTSVFMLAHLHEAMLHMS